MTTTLTLGVADDHDTTSTARQARISDPETRWRYVTLLAYEGWLSAAISSTRDLTAAQRDQLRRRGEVLGYHMITAINGAPAAEFVDLFTRTLRNETFADLGACQKVAESAVCTFDVRLAELAAAECTHVIDYAGPPELMTRDRTNFESVCELFGVGVFDDWNHPARKLVLHVPEMVTGLGCAWHAVRHALAARRSADPLPVPTLNALAEMVAVRGDLFSRFGDYVEVAALL